MNFGTSPGAVRRLLLTQLDGTACTSRESMEGDAGKRRGFVDPGRPFRNPRSRARRNGSFEKNGHPSGQLHGDIRRQRHRVGV